MTETKNNEKPEPKIVQGGGAAENEPTQEDLDAIDDEGDDEDAGDDEDDGVNVYMIYLRHGAIPVPAIDTREHAELLTQFGQYVNQGLPFFTFTGDPNEGYVGMALVKIDDVSTIQSVVTEAELAEYLAKDDGEDDGEVEESQREKAIREAEEKRARRRERREAEAAAAEGKVKAGNRGPKGGKGLKGLV